MAIVFTKLDSGSITTSPFNTASITPGGAGHVTLVAVSLPGATNSISSVSGGGLTWAVIASATDGSAMSPHAVASLADGTGNSPTTGALTVTITGIATSGDYVVYDVSGVSASPIVQNATASQATNSTTFATPASLSALSSPNNVVFSTTTVALATQTFTAGSSMTALDSIGTGAAQCLFTQKSTSPGSPTSVNCSWTSGKAAMVAIEIAAGAAAATTHGGFMYLMV